ncbi:MAG: efflux RND transporter periplasmic adaptor subunit [Comamonadaceae bacterium]|nr:efflux RND transporter periplasmic adaptor subunit [Comamonadaceae bacterium]
MPSDLHTLARWPAMLAAAVLLALLGACSRPEPTPPVVRSVKLLTAGASPKVARTEYAGVVTARSETTLGFRVAGKLLERPVAMGQAVRKGQLLAKLDASDYHLSAAAVAAQLRAAVTERDLQAADLKRFEELRAQNFISAAELDRRRAALKAAQSRVAQAQAQLAAQGNQTGYTRLVADADAIVTATLAEPGQVVAAGTPVVRLALDGQRDVSFAVPEQRLAQVRPGQQVQVRAWGEQPQPLLPARVREIAASADPATRTFAVKVEILGARQPPLGATVTVIWPQAASDSAPVIHLPGTAIWRNQAGRDAVWVFQPQGDGSSGTLAEREVALEGPAPGGWIVRSGLREGERVVSTGTHVVQAGELVRVYEGNPHAGAGRAAENSDAANASAPDGKERP